jgi:hypothetical protein
VTVLETERKNLKTLSDEELVKAAQNGDDEALEAILSRYKNLVYAKSKPYFLAGADDDDIIQEGLIGLYKAVMDFDGDRFPFLYFVSDYNLGYECAFPGCSHETEPSTAVVSHLIDFTREHNIPVVFYLELSSGKIARIISEDSSASTS